MRKILLFFACAVFASGIVKSQTITVSSPNGGETWAGCSSQTITWSHSGTSGFFNVEYSTNNGSSWASLANNYSGTSISWNPVPNISSSQALVRVYDYNNNTITDQSNANFTITPALIVTSPNGGEQWQVANPNTRTITWDGFGTSNSFLLEYSINGGSGWTTITSGTFTPSGNSYSYTWTVPNNPSAFCLVRVTDNGSPSCKKDASDNVFEIVAPTPVITVTSPNGGNTLYIGQSHTITWTSAYLSGSFVKIEYSTDNGSNWTTLFASTNNDGSESWTNIPNSPGSTCLVKISDATTPSTYDVSDAVFTIALGTIAVTYPNGGETLNGCQNYSITWTRTGTSNYFNVDYTTNNGGSWSSIATNYYQSGGTGSFTWTVPNISSSQARVRVRDYNNSDIIDSSDAVFTINPALVVTAPNGSETWQGGTSQTITWTQGPGASNYWTIQYSTDGGNNWTNIVYNTYITTGQYTWNPVANVPSANCLIRIYQGTSPSGNCRLDVSDNLFEITEAAHVITVTSPNGGETRYVGTAYNITWTSQYLTSSFVKIEYSTDNGTNWTTIFNSTNNDGSESWTVPNTPSANCLVRISEFGTPTVNDVSNAVFNIVYPYVTVTSPNGGETLNGCLNYTIQWQGYGAGSGPWRVEYSLNNGSSWTTLVSSTTSSSYSWNPILDTTSAQALIKVTKTTDALVLDSSNAVFTINEDNSIIVTSPNGGESWQVNNPSTQTITWTDAGTTDYYNIAYSTDGGSSWNTITNGTYITTNQYNWTIPNNPSTNCLVRIRDYYNTCKSDLSDAIFEIDTPNPVITVTSPNGGETRYVGTAYNITWTSQYLTSSFVKIEYSTDNGSNWSTIFNSTNNDGSESWTIPNTPSTNCLVRVSEYNNPSVKDSSNAVFSIVYPYVVVNNPNGGESWNGCSSQTISWSGYGTGSGPWKVEYSSNNGGSWTTLVSSTTSSSYNWNPVPNAPTSQGLVKVTKTTDALVIDSSNAVFTITQNLSIIVNSPNGGESWQVANPSTQLITWAWSGTSNYYNLYYSVDSGATWITITTGTYNTTGQYNWTVPNNPSANCLIKVEDYYNNCKFDISDAVFTIVAPTPVITVNSPNGGETRYVGTAYNITWSSQYAGSFVKIEYSTNNGSSWTTISSSTSNDGSESWTIPNTPSTQCLVKVSDVNTPTTLDSSNAVFSIVYPYVTVTVPNGAENVYGCGNLNIQWQGYGAGSGPWRVEYSLNNGSTWTTLVSSTSSTSYSWNPVLDTATTQALIKVTKTTDALVVDSSNAVFTINEDNSIIVTSPNGGESWQVNNPSTQTITWTDAGTTDYYNIAYSTDGGSSWNTITNGTYITTNQYNWTIPNNPSANCLVRIRDYYNTCKSDQSDAVFEIVAPTPTITVTSPNGGETRYVGSSYNITWTSAYLSSSFVKIEYSINNGSSWSTIFNSTNNDGTEPWTIPNFPSTNCLVRVSEYNNPSVKDSSNAVFSIVYPYVVVNNPNGGESWNGCSSQTISWSGYGTGSGPWKVEYSSNNGGSWTTLVSSTSSSSYNWNPVPNAPTSQGLVKVTKTTDALVIDSSNAVFTITQNTSVIVTSPNGGENWQVANPNSQLITWTMAGASNYYNIYYSTNGGSSWNTIITGTYITSNQYTWTIPNNPSANCLVKVEDYYNNCKFDISDAVFEIVAPTPVITVTYPNGGNTFYVGTSYNITWTSQYLTSSFVKLEYSTDNGSTWTTILNSTNNDGTQSWTIPNTPSSQCLVKVSEYGNPSVFDVSNSVFSIVAPYITVNSPNGGENWNGCTSQTISWTGYGTGSGPYMVEYSTDNGATWTTLVSSTTSTSTTWNPVPNTTYNQSLIRVSLVSNSSVYDESNAAFTINQQVYIIVNSPNGGESWQVANPTTQNINWAYSGTSNYFTLYYSVNGGTNWSTIANAYYAGTSGNGNYTWTVPNNPSNNVLIKVEDYYNTCKYDASDAPFTIVAPTPAITVTYPNGGQTLYSYNTATITWTSSYISSSFVKLDYSVDSGATWIVIASSTNNDGSHSWTVPSGVNSTKCLIRVTDFGNNATYDVSDAVFTIKPAVVVTAPNGGENLSGCTVTTINWQGESGTNSYQLQYSINGGSSWTTIVSQSFSGGPNYSYNWTLPNTPSAFCLVKVTNNSNTSKTDQSNAVFNIGSTITVTNPNNGGSYAIGSTLVITWTAQGVSDFYNIEYSTNGGSNWNTIAFNQNITTDSYNWTVPNAPSTNCLIRVTDNNASCKQDQSDVAFTISSSPASITVTSPNGAENWTACSVHNITWSANSTSGTYDIEYSSDNGSTWTTLANDYQSTNGVYSWTLPSTATTQGLARVKDSANVTLADQSNAVFTISGLSTPGAIAGNSTVCEGSSQTYSVALVSGATSYTWTLPSGWTGSSASNTITVVAGNTGGNISVVANNSCSSSASSAKALTVTALPAAPGAISGNASPCSGISETYSISAVSGATSYNWILPSGYSGSSTATSINVLIGANAGTIQVSASNTCGSGGNSSLNITPNGSSLPEQPGNITGATSPCVASSQVYSIVPVSGATSYTWTLPGTWTGTSTTNSITATVGTAGGNITVTANNSCGSSAAQTLAVGFSNVPNQPGTISGNTPVCLNSSNTYSISGVSGASSYTWTLPSGWTGSSSSTSIIAVAAGATGNVEVTANNSCGSSTPRTLSVTVNNPVTPAVSISSTATGTICANASVTFTASPTSGGTTPSYQWIKNNVAVGSNSAIYTASGWSDNDSVWVVLTSSATCVTSSTAYSNKIGLDVTPNVTPSISISADATSICAGQTVIFSSNVTNGGSTPGYQWRKNGINISGATSAAYSTNSIANGDAFTCVLTSNAACALPSTATSNSVAITVTNNVTPSISISASPSGAICDGGSVTFSSTINNGGSAPVYDWTVNGLSAGGGNTFTTTNLSNGDTVRCMLTSDLTCVTSSTANSNAIIQAVNAYVDPIVTIAADNNPICVGQNVTFTATPTYGGSSPAYQWRKNHSDIAGATSASYSTSTLADSDTIDVIITSNYACLNTTQDTSNEIIIVVTTSVIPDVTVAVSPDDTVCAGTNVTFTATPMNGGSTPSYQWKKNGTDISGATSSAYSSATLITNDVITVVMTSSAGCASPSTDTSDAVTMLVNANVTASVSISADVSSPVCDGTSVTFTASPANGGTTPSFQWKIDGTDVIGETNPTFTTVSLANTDQVSVEMVSSAQCATPSPATSNTLTYTVNSLPPTPVISASGPTTFCDGGSVTLTSSSASGNTWSTSETTQAINVLSSGTFSVTVTDGNNCSSSSAATVVTVNSNPSVTITHNDVSCNGDSNGDATVSASGGTSPYTYAWSDSGTDSTITGIAAGTYDVTVTDMNSCTATASATVGITTAISVADSMEYCKTQTPIAVLSGNPTGGIWTGSAGVIILGDDTLDVENTPWTLGIPHTLTYSLNGCSADAVLTITGSEAGNDTAVCVNDGTFNLQAPQPAGGTWSSIGSGGLADASTGQIDPVGLSGAIQYVYTHSGCPDTMTVTYREVVLSTSLTNESCTPGNDGVVGVSASGGTSPYSYSWSSGGTASSETGLVAGTYNVTVSDNDGCSETDSITITKDAAPDVTVSQSAVSICEGDSAMISASGADSYSWSPASGLSDATAAGPMASPDSTTTYVVIGTVSGCSDTDSVVVTVNPLPAAPTVTVNGSTNLCPGDTITLSSGSSVGNTWSAGDTTQSVSIASAGTYTVTETDDYGCTSASSSPVVVTASPVPVITAGGAATFCEGGSVTLTSSSATGNTWSPNGETTVSIIADSSADYSVTVDDGSCVIASNTITVTVNPLPAPAISAGGATTFCSGDNVILTSSASSGIVWSPNSETTQSITVTASGNYSVTETDVNGCVGISDSISVTVNSAPATPVVSASGPTTFCSGDSVTLTSSSATDNTWSPNGETTQSITVNSSGNYAVSVSDINGCSATSAVTNVTVNNLPVADAGQDVTITLGTSTTLSGSGGTSCTWSPSNDLSNANICNPSANPASTTPYQLTVVDANGCSDIDSVIVNVVIPNPPVADFTATQVNITAGSSINFLDLSTNSPTSWSWTFNGGTPSSSTSQNPSGIVYNTPGCYDVTLIVANAGGADTVTKTCYINVTAPLSCGSGSACATPVDSVQIGTGTATINNQSYPNIYGNWYWGSRHQLLYRASELQAMGFTGGTISKLAFNVASNSGTTGYSGFTIKVGCTSATSITTFQTGLTTVYSQNVVVALGWNTYTLTTPYVWDGTSNVIIEVCFNNSSYTVNAPTYYTTTSYTSVVYFYQDASGTCAVNTVGGTSAARPNTKFHFCEPFSCPNITVTASKTDPTCGNSTDGTASASATGGATPYTYNWSNGATGANISGLAAGTYAVSATDNNGCTGVNVVILIAPAGISGTIASTDASCNGSCNGSLSVAATGGATPYSYSWSGGLGTGSSVTNVCSGVYTVTITDNNGCTTSASDSVNQPAALVASASSTGTSCNGGNDGTATAAVTGGTSPYSYLWSDGQTVPTATGLVAGNYSVTVTDDNGCTSNASVTVSEPSALTAGMMQTDVSCNGGNDGDAMAMPSGGTSPYTYLWSNGQTAQTATGLTAGSYDVTVTDNNGCTATGSVTVTEPASPLSAAISSSNDASCSGSADGDAAVNASGGTSPYSYLWSDGQSNAAATGLLAGNYDVTVTDNNGCTTTANATVSEPAGISLTTSATPANCNSSDGSATVNASGGAGGFTYLWEDGQTTSTAAGLAKGNHSVTVTDANTCTNDTSVYVGEVGGLTVSISSSSDVNCFGGNDGAAVASGSAGTSPYTYLWNDVSATADDSVSGLPAGIYIVTITDNTGCTDTASVTISEPVSVLAASIASSSNVSCFGASTGSATVAASGGTSPYTQVWSTGGTGTTESGLSAGTAMVTVTDANGCTATASVIITEPSSALSASISGSSDVSCLGGNDGTATAAASGGTSGYTFLWSDGQTNATATGLAAGSYGVTVTDANGCSASSSATISQPVTAVSVLVSSSTNVSCFNGTNGSATANASGGTSGYSYAWSNGSASASLSGLAAGTYTVTATDANGCTATASVTITQPSSALSASVSTTTISCFGNADGAASVSAAGGTTGYSYLWSNGATSASLSGLTAGTYSATVTDANGCTATASGTVTGPSAALSAGISSQANVTCFGLCNGSATPGATGGTSPYNYIWSNGGNGTSLCAGSYSVTVTDANGCTANTSVTITQPSSAVAVSISSQANVNCNGASTGSATVAANGGTSPYSYSWSNGATSASLSGLAAGTYTVTATDANGCTANTSVTISQPSAIAATGSSTAATCGNSNGTATVTASGGTSPYTYNWSNGATSASLSGLAAGTYNYTVTDANICTKTGSVTVNAASAPTVTISSNNITCNGASNGTASASVAGGTSPFTYLWSNGSTAAAIAGLSPGSYSVTVTDANACTGNQSVTITQPQPLIITSTTTDNTQTPCNGTVTVSVVGGTSPYTYFWNNGQTSNPATGLCGGNYSVTVTDASQCTQFTSAAVLDNIGMEEYGSALRVNIYPNPNNGAFVLMMENFGDGSIVITNLLGELVYNRKIINSSSSIQIDLEGIARGVYNLQLISEGGTISRKLIIE